MIKDGEKVIDIAPGAVVTVTTGSGVYRGRSLVITAGPWANTLLTHTGLQLPLKVEQPSSSFIYSFIHPFYHWPCPKWHTSCTLALLEWLSCARVRLVLETIGCPVRHFSFQIGGSASFAAALRLQCTLFTEVSSAADFYTIKWHCVMEVWTARV